MKSSNSKFRACRIDAACSFSRLHNAVPGAVPNLHCRAEEGTQTPSLPRTPSRLQRAPSLSANRYSKACPLASGSPKLCSRIWLGALASFIGKGCSRLYAASQHLGADEPYCFPPSNQHAQRKPNSLIPGSAVQPSAGRPSSHSFHSEVFSSARLLLSIPLVQLCAAHTPKPAPCSLPRPSAPLRSGD